MALPLFKAVAESNTRLAGAAIFEIFCSGVMFWILIPFEKKYGGGHPPDLWFGISDNKLYDYLNEIGPDGRKGYAKLNAWDLFPYMWGYTILFGSLLYRQCQKSKISTNLSLIYILAVLSDCLESFICRHATKTFPERIHPDLLTLASLGNQMKWLSFLLGKLILGALLVRNSKDKTTAEETEKNK